MRQNSCSTPSAASAGLTWSRVADRHAARRDDDIGRRERALERLACRLGVVAARARPTTTSAPACSQRAAIRMLFDSWICPWRSGSPGATSSSPVTTTQTRGRAVTAELGDAAGRDRGERERAAAGCPPRRRPLPRRHPCPGAARGPDDRRVRERDAVAVHVRALDRHDGVGARRQRRAGGDRHRRVRLELRGIVAGERSACDRQLGAGVLGAHGEAVHRGVVERRQSWAARTSAATTRPASALVSASARPGAARAARAGAPGPRPGAGVGDPGGHGPML